MEYASEILSCPGAVSLPSEGLTYIQGAPTDKAATLLAFPIVPIQKAKSLKFRSHAYSYRENNRAISC